MTGMRLLWQHPRVATRDCTHCQRYQYDETTGLPVETAKGSGQYHERYPNVPAPCRTTGCAKGTPENPRSLNEANEAAYLHYLECRAVGFGERERRDPIVRRNARLIRGVLDEADRARKQEFERTIVEVALAGRLK